MDELELPGMQGLAGKAGQRLATVQGVAHQRMADVGHVHADLVGAAGFQFAEDGSGLGIGAGSQQSVVGAGRLAGRRLHDSHAQTVAFVTADVALDGALGRRLAAGDGQVASSHLPAGQLGGQAGKGAFAAGADQQAAGVAVQPVDDAGPRQPGGLRVGMKQAVHEGVAPVSGGGMGDEPGRLVDDGDVGVLMDDGKRHRVGCKGGVAFQRLRFDLNALDALQAQRRQPYLLVDAHCSQGDPALDACARDAVEPFLQVTGQELVEPLALPFTRIDDKERVGGGFGAEVVGQTHDDGGAEGTAGS